MTIARKLWLGFGGLILIFLVSSLLVLFSERKVESALDEIVNVEEPTSNASHDMHINALQISRDVREYLYSGDPAYREQFEDDRADFEEYQALHAELVETPTGREHVEQIDSLYQEYLAAGQSLIDDYDERAANADGPVQASEIRAFLEVEASLDNLLREEVHQWTDQQLEEAERDAEDAVRSVYTSMLVLLLLGLLVGSLAAYFTNRGIIRSVYKLEEGARRIGQGDLEHRIELDTRDEIGEVAVTFNEMAERRKKAEEELQESQKRFEQLFNQSVDALVVHDESGRIVDCNTEAYRSLGYSKEELLSLSIGDISTNVLSPEERVAKERRRHDVAARHGQRAGHDCRGSLWRTPAQGRHHLPRRSTCR
jgi:PAS domain S-box-containing protein